MIRTSLFLLCFIANAQETIKPDFSFSQEEWTGYRLAIWSNGFHMRKGERTNTSLRVFDQSGAFAFEVSLAKSGLPGTTVDDVLRLDDGSVIAAVRTYEKDIQSQLLFMNPQGQVASTQRLTPFRPMRLWLEASGKIAILGRVSSSDDPMDAEPQTRELVLRTYENGSRSLRMLSSKATGLVLPIPTTLEEWEPRDIMPAGGHVAVLIARSPKPHFAEISVADGSVVGDWTFEGPTITREGKAAPLTLGEFALTAAHRLIGFFSDNHWSQQRYYELDRVTRQWTPVNALNRLSGPNNIYAADGERVLVFIPYQGRFGFAWLPIEESTQSANRRE